MEWTKGIMCFAFVLICVNLYSQFGVRAKYNVNNYNPSQEFFSLNNGLEIGVDYWLRLKDRRLEFLPELSYETAKANVNFTPSDVSFNSINFNLNINIYPLDFYNDCDCPTFSKDGNALTKGFHFILTPGLRYYSWDHENIADNNKINLMAGVGAGLDLGVNDLLTIAPFALFRHSFTKEIEFTDDIGAGNIIEDNNGQILLGIRLGFRPDYQTPRFRR